MSDSGPPIPLSTPPFSTSTPGSRPPSHLHTGGEPVPERRTLRDYYIILQERLWIALPVALLLAVGYGYYQLRKVPQFESVATMRFERPEKVVLNPEVVDPSVRSDIDLNTYLQILTSPHLRNRVLDSLTPEEITLLQRPWHGRDGKGPAPTGGALLGSVSVDARANSFVIAVIARNRDPAGAALIANRTIEQFMQYLSETVGGRSEFAVDYLRKRAETLRTEASAADSKVQAYMQEHQLVSLDNSLNIVSERLRAINGALTAARLDRIELETTDNQVASYQADGKDLLELTFIASHGNIPALKSQLADLRQRESVLAERYFEKHPRMIEAANAISAAQAQLDRAIKLAIADLKSRLEQARKTEARLEGEYAFAEKEALRLKQLSVEYDSLAGAAQVAKDNYEKILDRLNQVTTSKDLENIPVSPLDRATAPSSPVEPSFTRTLRTAIGLFIASFLGVALGLSFLDDRIKSAWDVEHFIGAPLLGVIPDLVDVKDNERHTLVQKGEGNPGAEAFLSLYSSAKIHSQLDYPKTILVTSTIPGEGKTLISSNLAGAFARHGRRTLLVDCDLRRPMLHRHWDLPNDSGLLRWHDAGARLLENPLTDPELGIVKLGENLWLLRSGGRSKAPTELLETIVFGQLLDRLKRHFDLMLIDSPPMGAVTDALLIAERTDEVIYVCRFNRAYRKHIRVFVNHLRSAKNEILGVVLNGISARRIAYYTNYRYYRSYKKYYGKSS